MFAILNRLPSWILLAAFLGAALWAGVLFSRDYRREQSYLEDLFAHKGEVFIHSLEMFGRFEQGREDRMETLLTRLWNNLETDEVVLLALTDGQGRVLASAGESDPTADLFADPGRPEAEPDPGRLRWRQAEVEGRGVFLVYRQFWSRPSRMRGRRHEGHAAGWPAFPAPPAVRYFWVGFDPAPFVESSRARVRTAALFIGLLGLGGLGGVLALVWAYQSRLTRKLYGERLETLARMAAGLAHEIRNPLGALSGLAQHLLQKHPEERESLEVMKTCVDRLNATVTGFLEYARPAEMESLPVELGGLLRRLAALVGHDARSREVTMTLALPEAEVFIRGDESGLSRAFLNLYLNAIQAAGQNGAGRPGRLTVTLAAENGRAVVRFEDSGPGFSPEQLARPFVPYFTTRADGSGLGLAMVEKTVTAHPGGRVGLANHAGGGALVTASFPLPGEGLK